MLRRLELPPPCALVPVEAKFEARGGTRFIGFAHFLLAVYLPLVNIETNIMTLSKKGQAESRGWRGFRRWLAASCDFAIFFPGSVNGGANFRALWSDLGAPSAVRHCRGPEGVCVRATLALQVFEASGRAGQLFLRGAPCAVRGFGPMLHRRRPRCGFGNHRRQVALKGRLVVILSLDAGHTTPKAERARTSLCMITLRSVRKHCRK